MENQRSGVTPQLELLAASSSSSSYTLQPPMAASSDDDEIIKSELEHYESMVYNLLKTRRRRHKITRPDGSFRCPFCISKKRKQIYIYKDLLKHASGIGASNDHSFGQKASHLALARFLRSDIPSSNIDAAAPPPPSGNSSTSHDEKRKLDDEMHKEDIELETGEYFMSNKTKIARKWQQKLEKQAQKSVENKRNREAAFVPPKEPLRNMADSTKSSNDQNEVAAVTMSLKEDIKLEIGEYFMSNKTKTARKWQQKLEKQAQKSVENKRNREAAFVPPKKKAKDFQKDKANANIKAESYIADAENPPRKKSKSSNSG